MADRYLLESGAPDGYQLEDGTGVLLLEGTAITVSDIELVKMAPLLPPYKRTG